MERKFVFKIRNDDLTGQKNVNIVNNQNKTESLINKNQQSTNLSNEIDNKKTSSNLILNKNQNLIKQSSVPNNLKSSLNNNNNGNKNSSSSGGGIASFLSKNKRLMDENYDNNITPDKKLTSSSESNIICLNSPVDTIKNKTVHKASSSSILCSSNNLNNKQSQSKSTNKSSKQANLDCFFNNNKAKKNHDSEDEMDSVFKKLPKDETDDDWQFAEEKSKNSPFNIFKKSSENKKQSEKSENSNKLVTSNSLSNKLAMQSWNSKPVATIKPQV